MNLDTIRNGHGVKRCHTIPIIQEETVGHHSAGVAGILIYLYYPEFPPGRLLVAALVHDLAEHKLGDVPATAKWAHAPIAEAHKVAEQSWYEDFAVPNPDHILNQDEITLLKFADMYDLHCKCEEELLLGNSTVTNMRARAMAVCQSLILHIDSQWRPKCELLLSP